MIHVVFLGTGAAIPSPERSLPAIALKHRSVYLFDCGEGTQRQMMRLKVSYAKVKAIFISHPHLDHYLGIFGLIETLRLIGRTEPLYIFAPKEIAPMLRPHPFVHFEALSSKLSFKDDDFTISAFENGHSPNNSFGTSERSKSLATDPRCNSFGFILEENSKRKFDAKKAHSLGMKGKMFREIQEKGKIKVGSKTIALEDISELKRGTKIVYSGDTVFSDAVVQAAKGCDLLIHESTFGEDKRAEADERGHSTAKDAAKAAKLAKAKQLILFHIGNRYKDTKVLEKEARELFKNTKAAFDGMALDL